MKKKIIYSVIVISSFYLLMNFASKANANDEIIGIIKSAPGESQASFVARNSFKSFTCESGTTRVDGVDLNFTSTSSDDVYFAYCVKTNIQPAPVITPIVPIVDTTTATATAVATPAVTIPAPYKIETQTVAPVMVQQIQPVETKTATIEPVKTTITTQSNVSLITAKAELEEIIIRLKTQIIKIMEMLRKLK
jgi:hypothetical protein